MAMPIKPTPILDGKDAQKFEAAIRLNETDPSRKVSRETYDRAMSTYHEVIEKMRGSK